MPAALDLVHNVRTVLTTQSHLLDYVGILWRRRNVAIVVAIAVAFVYARRIAAKKDIYRATTKLIVELNTGRNSLGNSNPYDSYWYQLTDLQTQKYIVTSEPIATRVVDLLQMAPMGDEEKLAAAVAEVRGAISIDQVEGTRVFLISAQSLDPDKAAALANTTAGVYVEHHRQKRLRNAEESLTWLRTQLSELEGRLKRAQDEMVRYVESEGLPPRDGGAYSLSDEDRRLQSEHQAAKTEVLRLEAELRTLYAYRGSEVSTDVLRGLPGGGSAADLADQLDQVEIELAQNLKRYQDKHPTIIRLREQLQTLREKAAGTVERRILEVDARLAAARSQRDALDAEVRRAKRQALQASRKQARYDILAQKAESNRDLYNIILKKLEQADVSAGVDSVNILVIERAAVPGAPIAPNRPREYSLGVGIAILLGLGLAYLVEYLDRTVHDAAEAQRLLGIPPLATMYEMSRADLDDRLLVMRDEPRSPEAEAFRTLRTNLRFAAASPQFTVAVTSAEPREGKTTIASNLAVALASAEKPTVLLDADLRRPRVHEQLSISNEIGLTDFLSGQTPLDRILRPSDVPGLSVVTSGGTAPNPAELLDSARLSELIEELGSRFSQVVFDTPPVLSVVDPLVVAARVSGVVFVLNAHRSDKAHAGHARAQLETSGAKLYGFVLNGVQRSGGRYGDSYRYYDYSAEPVGERSYS